MPLTEEVPMSTTNARKNLLPYMALLTATFLWASSFVALKLAFHAYPPMVVIFGRMAIGTLCVLCIPGLFRKNRVRKKDIKSIALMVLLEPCLYFLFEAKAIELTTASQAGMITALLPLMVSCAAFFVLKEPLGLKTLAGLGLSVFGACWLSFGGEATMDAPNPPLGNLFELIAMVCAAGYTIILKQLTERGYTPLFLTAVQAFAGTLFYFPLVFMDSPPMPTAAAPVAMAAVIYLGSVVTLGAYGCFNYGVSRIPAGQASAFVNLIPVFALFMGMAVLKERLTFEQYIACAIVFSGLYLSQQTGETPAGTPPLSGKHQ